MTLTEERVACIYAEIIGTAPARPEQDIFDLQGDSHHAVLIALEIEAEFGLDLPVEKLGDLGKIRDVAAWIDARASPEPEI
jgi:acyl carrier protein